MGVKWSGPLSPVTGIRIRLPIDWSAQVGRVSRTLDDRHLPLSVSQLTDLLVGLMFMLAPSLIPRSQAPALMRAQLVHPFSHRDQRDRWCQRDAQRSNASIERSLNRYARRREMCVAWTTSAYQKVGRRGVRNVSAGERRWEIKGNIDCDGGLRERRSERGLSWVWRQDGCCSHSPAGRRAFI